MAPKHHPGLPGFGLPLNHVPTARDPFFIDKPFPSALDCGDIAQGRTFLNLTPLRELTMLQFMNIVTDKPDWHKKIFDGGIAEKWRQEALAIPDEDFTEKMATWCIEELKFAASRFAEDRSGAIVVYNANVVKSDTAVSPPTKEALRAAVRPLEEVPARLKDWHPGSKEKVLDLVHPSLFPLIYGRTRILPLDSTNSTTGLFECIRRCGEGRPVPAPPEDEAALGETSRRNAHIDGVNHPFSLRFQWLPCEVDVSNAGSKITSYINNLHPIQYRDLYTAIEEVIDAAIPLWNISLAPLHGTFHQTPRIVYDDCIYDPDPEHGPEEEGPQQGSDEDEDDFNDRRDEWVQEIRQVVLPDAGVFQPLPEPPIYDLKKVMSSSQRTLQIIVKLANIELTPEKPAYEGGSWHVEGQLNEHICATALYYYSSENISKSSLAFRQQVDPNARGIIYEQNHHDWLEDVFGCEQEGPAVQDIGSVETREDRLLTFPNVLQHQVQPFELADPEKPGHRKILALFLVDPNIRIMSTANVPPQQLDWWKAETTSVVCEAQGLDKLPVELQDRVFEEVEDFPISLKEAKRIRLELMEERKKYVVEHGKAFEGLEFSLCEH